MVAPSKNIAKTTRVRISKSGQITLPASARQQLGVGVGEQVDIVQKTDGTVSVKPVRYYSADELAGSFGARPADIDVDDLIREGVRDGIERKVKRWKE